MDPMLREMQLKPQAEIENLKPRGGMAVPEEAGCNAKNHIGAGHIGKDYAAPSEPGWNQLTADQKIERLRTIVKSRDSQADELRASLGWLTDAYWQLKQQLAAREAEERKYF